MEDESYAWKAAAVSKLRRLPTSHKRSYCGVLRPEERLRGLHIASTGGRAQHIDAALNNGKIWRIPEVWTKVKEGLQTVWSKCLGRMWYSSPREVQELNRRSAPNGGEYDISAGGPWVTLVGGIHR